MYKAVFRSLETSMWERSPIPVLSLIRVSLGLDHNPYFLCRDCFDFYNCAFLPPLFQNDIFTCYFAEERVACHFLYLLTTFSPFVSANLVSIFTSTDFSFFSGVTNKCINNLFWVLICLHFLNFQLLTIPTFGYFLSVHFVPKSLTSSLNFFLSM